MPFFSLRISDCRLNCCSSGSHRGGREKQRVEDARRARTGYLRLLRQTVNNAPFSERVMQGIDAFLDTYVRIDEGTRVLLCAHRSCARTAAWLYAAIFIRGTEPSTFVFDHDNAETEMTIGKSLADLRMQPGVRRVVVIVCEPSGPSFVRIFEQSPTAHAERAPIYRISGSSSGLFEPARRSSGNDKRVMYSLEGSLDDNGHDEPGLSDTEIDELLEQCGFEMAGLDDCDIEEVAAMSAEEIGSLTDEELAALAELEDSELLELASGWGEEDFRVLA